ncbi:MAG: LytTR family transcriptional regulator [SAR324 cluster bacterium]|nr:LytTR family transcriptional regulator [SAR324 cluster bacterium]
MNLKLINPENLDRLKDTTRYILVPLLMCTLIGGFIGIITNIDSSRDKLLTDIGVWVFRINVGAMCNITAFLAGQWVFKWETKNSFQGIWRQAAIGYFLTFLAMFFTNDDITDLISVLFLAVSVLIIAIIVYVFLFQVGFFKRLDQSLSTVTDFLTLKENDRIEKIAVGSVSFIKVEDHYCTVVYQQENEWKEWTLHGKLKNFEEEYKNSFLRINRSTLVNPKWVEKVEKTKGKHVIYMKHKDKHPFPLSPSQEHLLDQLIPIIGK